ncbi:ribosomal protein S18-alanine N-acetyltransferase [Parasphingorhabdus halotolerans]|uniref:[Ribosomal protein bS18]-alanine N-acetyltransferase n=2 Tax=Parasphingorhabdus halotolerans TaxID=2725558 RepID=A0A6H2DIK6_9SPHN|nr:ribosomal protein S18-alanine N-acetyltransferase [Parasphingorhabdus halotolerans]
MTEAFSPEFGESWNENQCRSMLSLPGTKLILAQTNQDYCGFIISRTVLDEEELLMIAVSPGYQKKGLGRILLKKLIENARNRGITSIFLEVRSTNKAQILYGKFGFQKIGFRKAYYTGNDAQKFDAISYRLDL